MDRPAGGWSFYPVMERHLVSAILWFWFGMQQKDKNIYWPCVGWIVLDVAVITGVIIYR